MAILTNYKAPSAVNPFAKTIDEMVDAGEGAAFELIANTEKTEGVRGTIASQRARFQDAARDAGYSAKTTENDEREDGTTRLVFVLVPRRTRKPNTVKPDAKADAPKAASKTK